MDTEELMKRHGYLEGFVLLPREHLELAQAILFMGRAGDISAGMVPPLLVQLFATAHPDGDDRDHHRGALMFLAHEGGFTAPPPATVAGEEMRVRPGLPEWVFDERFTDLMQEMEQALQAEINVVPVGDSITVMLVPTFLTNSREEPEGYVEQVMSYQPAVRAAVASILGRDPGYIPIVMPSIVDPIKDIMGVHAATPVPPADPVDKVILPTRDLRCFDLVKVYEVCPTDTKPIKSPSDEVFRVDKLEINSGADGYEERLTIVSTNLFGQYDRDFNGYRWEVVERNSPRAMMQEANRIAREVLREEPRT